MKNYVIFGDSKYAERIGAFILSEKEHNLLAFTNEEKFITRSSILGIEVIPFENLSQSLNSNDFEIIIAYGYTNMNNLREKIYNRCIDSGYKVGKYISKNAICYANDSDLDEGVIIFPNTMIDYGVKIGKCTIVSQSVLVADYVTIKDFCYLSGGSGIGGNSYVGDHCFVGMRSTIKNGVNLARYSFIGIAANVLKDTEDNCIYVGNPAKAMQNKNSLDITKV